MGSTRAEALRRVVEAIRAATGALEAAGAALLLLTGEPEPAAATQDDMLTVPEAAREIRRSPAFIRAQCRLGRIKSMKDANGYRIRRSALLTYERKRTS